jgi:heme O synthase-like polyprenyltransferase
MGELARESYLAWFALMLVGALAVWLTGWRGLLIAVLAYSAGYWWAAVGVRVARASHPDRASSSTPPAAGDTSASKQNDRTETSP